MSPLLAKLLRRSISKRRDIHHPDSPFARPVYERNATIYKLLAHPIRLEILNVLKSRGETSVELLLQILKVRKANLSQHLSLLRHTKTVIMRKDGLNVYYQITDPRLVEPCRILKEIWETNK